jgi:hypothetical protein
MTECKNFFPSARSDFNAFETRLENRPGPKLFRGGSVNASRSCL